MHQQRAADYGAEQDGSNGGLAALRRGRPAASRCPIGINDGDQAIGEDGHVQGEQGDQDIRLQEDAKCPTLALDEQKQRAGDQEEHHRQREQQRPPPCSNPPLAEAGPEE
jgi:hypothetical protein